MTTEVEYEQRPDDIHIITVTTASLTDKADLKAIGDKVITHINKHVSKDDKVILDISSVREINLEGIQMLARIKSDKRRTLNIQFVGPAEIAYGSGMFKFKFVYGAKQTMDHALEAFNVTAAMR
jgi:hypothetical protein